MLEGGDLSDDDIEKVIGPPLLPPVVDKLDDDKSDLGLIYQCWNLMILVMMVLRRPRSSSTSTSG